MKGVLKPSHRYHTMKSDSIISKKQLISFSILFIITAFWAAIPIVYIVYSVGDRWQGVIPDGYVRDNEFYMVRMVKGTQNFPFGNNPFFIERAKDTNPALSIADYLAALPLKAGLSLTATLIFNSVFWNLIFVYLLWLFLKQVGIRNNWAFYLIPPIYLEVYGAMIRPVVLQTVLPFFTFFLLGFATWLKKPTLLNNLVFAVGIAGTLYIYPYTWQIAFSILGVSFLWFLKNRQWARAKSELKIICLALIIAFPAVYALYKIFSNPLFPDLLKNVGSIKTHFPSRLSFTLGRWVITSSFLWYLTARFTSLKEDKDFKFLYSFLLIIGFGIIIVLMSPIITGRDGAIGDHVGRELYFWLAISTSILAYLVFARSNLFQLQFYKKMIIVLLLIVNLAPVVKHYKRSLLQPFYATRSKTLLVQDYAKPIAWLHEYDKNPRVVWADGPIGSFVPILSRHYNMHPPDLAYQYWVPMPEMRERYLISEYFTDPKFLAKGSTISLGHSYVRRLDDLNWKSDLCGIFKIMGFDRCNPKSSGLTLAQVKSLKDEDIKNLIEKNNKEIKPNIDELLRKYQVTYAIKDKLNKNNFNVEKLKNVTEIYNDSRFIIYEFRSY